MRTHQKHGKTCRTIFLNAEEFQKESCDDVPTPRDVPANSSQESEKAAPKVGVVKHNTDTHVPKDQKLRDIHANEIYEGSLQAAHW